MMSEVIKFIANINIAYVSLVMVLFILSSFFMSYKKVNLYLRELYIVLFVILSWIGFYFFNDVINDIFKFSYYNIRSYLLLLIVVNIITIININYVKKILYKIINYMMFSINVLIFLTNILLYFTNRFDYSVSVNIFSNLMNINYIIFLVYLNIILYLYLISVIINKIKNRKLVKDCSYEEIDNQFNIDKEENIVEDNEESIIFVNQDLDAYSSKDSNTLDNNSFVIDGVDCSAIFDGSNQAEVMENYYILLNDVNAKLVNGYTIHEYTKIKDIINRLNIKDLSNIDLDINKLSMITYDEYNLLKNYLNNMNIKI